MRSKIRKKRYLQYIFFLKLIKQNKKPRELYNILDIIVLKIKFRLYRLFPHLKSIKN